MSKPFQIKVTPFDGDPQKVDFFREQIEAVVKLNNLSDEEALNLIKSKLNNAALQYYIDSPSLKLVTTVKKFS
jgi:hypothetical protein